MRDIPEGFETGVAKVLDEVGKVADEIETLLNRNRIWQKRTKGVGVISKERCQFLRHHRPGGTGYGS
jgi:NADH-quinone oxidoreductase subunit D